MSIFKSFNVLAFISIPPTPTSFQIISILKYATRNHVSPILNVFSTSLIFRRIEEGRENDHDEDLPLLPLEDEEEIFRPVKDHRKAKLSILAIFGLLCIFIFIISTVLFAVLYVKLLKSTNKIPEWPKPSPSVLGEYSTAAVAADNEMCSDIGRFVLIEFALLTLMII